MHIFTQIYLAKVYIYADIYLRYNVYVKNGCHKWPHRNGGMDTVPATKAQQKAVNKYMAANYDRINLTVDKGKKELIKAHAAKQDGGSVNAFINRAIDETMERDGG